MPLSLSDLGQYTETCQLAEAPHTIRRVDAPYSWLFADRDALGAAVVPRELPRLVAAPDDARASKSLSYFSGQGRNRTSDTWIFSPLRGRPN